MSSTVSDNMQEELMTARTILIAQYIYPNPYDAWKSMRSGVNEEYLRELEKAPAFMRRMASMLKAKGLDQQAREHTEAATWAETIIWYAHQDRKKPELMVFVNHDYKAKPCESD